VGESGGICDNAPRPSPVRRCPRSYRNPLRQPQRPPTAVGRDVSFRWASLGRRTALAPGRTCHSPAHPSVSKENLEEETTPSSVALGGGEARLGVWEFGVLERHVGRRARASVAQDLARPGEGPLRSQRTPTGICKCASSFSKAIGEHEMVVVRRGVIKPGPPTLRMYSGSPIIWLLL
jgi:hypothetical protein